MNRKEVKIELKDILDKIGGGSLVLRKKDYTEEEVADIKKELLKYLNERK